VKIPLWYIPVSGRILVQNLITELETPGPTLSASTICVASIELGRIRLPSLRGWSEGIAIPGHFPIPEFQD